VINKIKNRLASEQGFTLIELLVVIVILGILVAIAVPSYLSFRGNASQAAAQANVRSAIPAAEGYYQEAAADGGGGQTYAGMTNAKLQTVAPGVAPNVKVALLNSNTGYCLEDTEVPGSLPHTFYYIGGVSTGSTGAVGTVTQGDCSTNDGGVAAA
jgi:type IV pilus assembly protein PilA